MRFIIAFDSIELSLLQHAHFLSLCGGERRGRGRKVTFPIPAWRCDNAKQPQSTTEAAVDSRRSTTSHSHFLPPPPRPRTTHPSLLPCYTPPLAPRPLLPSFLLQSSNDALKIYFYKKNFRSAAVETWQRLSRVCVFAWLCVCMAVCGCVWVPVAVVDAERGKFPLHFYILCSKRL